MANINNVQLQEIFACGKDPIYFINKYCKISHPTKGLLQFKTYPFQDDCVKAFQKHKYNIVNKSRQLGISTIVAAYSAWLILFQRDQSILCLATKKATAVNLIKKIKVIIDNLPQWLIVPKRVGETKQSIEYDNRSQVQAIPTSEDAGRSEALSLLIVDEAAHIKSFSELWTGLSPTLSEGGKVVIISTPKGVGNQFHTLYKDAEAGINEFNSIKLPWTVHPTRDERWYKNECSRLGNSARKIGQELLCEFATSGETFITNDDIAWIGANVKPPIDRQGDDRSVWIWVYPVIGHKYMISADIARGDSEDYSTFHIIDSDTAEVVAEYKGRVPPDRFGEMLDTFGKKYNTALLCPENNTYGYATLVKLKQLNYPKIFKKDDKSLYLGNYSPMSDDVGKYGIFTDGKTRLQILTKLEEVIRNRYIRIYSSRFYDELKSFIWTEHKAQAKKNCNDDLIISMAIGSWLFDASSGYSKHDVGIQHHILKGMEVSSRELPTANMTRPNPWGQHFSKSPAMMGVGMQNGAFGPRFQDDFNWVLDRKK